MLHPLRPALILAPMEGVTDAPMRALQGASGAFSFSVSEFLRVTHSSLPKSVILRHVPELLSGACTPTGLPVQVQLLGGDADRLATSAVTACEVGAKAIDLNFGCPARTVNRHDGGAALLGHPHRIRDIVRAVRSAVPAEVPVSAKLRLGWDRVDSIFENARMAAEGGASWITIHARTRTQGYQPPVYWSLIGQVREQLELPVVANGDIHSIEGFRACREVTGCCHFMLGRGALANPGLALQLAHELGIAAQEANLASSIDWSAQLQQLLIWTPALHAQPGTLVRRMKQWLKMAETFGSFTRFDEIKRADTVTELLATLSRASSAPAKFPSI